MTNAGANEFRFPVRVYYEDTDASGVAYHAGYLRWFERARTEWLRALGLEQEGLREQLGVVFTVATLEIRYRRPARLDDLLDIVTTVPQPRKASICFEQTLWRAGESSPLASARVKVGCVDAVSFRPTPVPDALTQSIGRWAGYTV